MHSKNKGATWQMPCCIIKGISILMSESSILDFGIDLVNFQVFYLTFHKKMYCSV